MSNTEVHPPVIGRGGRAQVTARPVLDLIPGRTASLGSGTEVRRLLPTLGRRLVGAWCFLDHYGPDDIAAGPGMQIAPHPHTGLQTVSWLLTGSVHHRDSLGNDVTFGPGELALMTAGRAIAHSEQSPTPHPAGLHGTQLWVALPDSVRDAAPSWDFHASLPEATIDAARVRVMVGEFGGLLSPAKVHTPIVGVDLDFGAAGSAEFRVEPDFEYAAICVDGAATVEGVGVPVGSLLYLGAGRSRLRVSTDGPAHLLLLGGEPFVEPIVMWWNFIGRSHEEIEALRSDWQEHRRFTDVAGWGGRRTDAPPLPALRLRPRG